MTRIPGIVCAVSSFAEKKPRSIHAVFFKWSLYYFVFFTDIQTFSNCLDV